MASLETSAVAPSAAIRIETDSDGHRRLVAAGDVAAGSAIARLEGTCVVRPTRYSIQVGSELHATDLGPIDATNHSCDPSAVVTFTDLGRPFLRARRDIPAGHEISIHYCATEFDMAVPFDCTCGAPGCFGTIRGYRHLNPAEERHLEGLLGRPLPAWSELR